MRVYDPLLDVSYFVPMEWLGNESWRGPPPGADGFSVYVLEGVVCDLMLAGWVFRASRVWRMLNWDCRRLIFQHLTTRITWTHLSTHTGRIAVRELLTTSPAALLKWGFRPRLNYKRRPLRGIQAPFMHAFEHRGRLGVHSPPAAGNPFAGFFGPPRDMPDPNVFFLPRPLDRGRDHANTQPSRDNYNRDARGRVRSVKGKPKARIPKNVAWQKGKHTRRRCRGK